MIQKLKSSFLILASLAALAIPVALPASASAAPTPAPAPNVQDAVCSGTSLKFDTAPTTTCSAENKGAGSTFDTILTNIVNILSIVVGIVAVIMIIVGGFRYITSGGASEAVSGAKKTILYALVGLVIVVLAQFIVHFVLGQALGLSK